VVRCSSEAEDDVIGSRGPRLLNINDDQLAGAREDPGNALGPGSARGGGGGGRKALFVQKCLNHGSLASASLHRVYVG